MIYLHVLYRHMLMHAGWKVWDQTPREGQCPLSIVTLKKIKNAAA